MSNNINKADIDDSRLVIDLKDGNERAYRQLVGKYQAKLRNVAYGITLDVEESADIIQDVFLKAYMGIDKFKGESTLYTSPAKEGPSWSRPGRKRSGCF